MNKFPLPVMLPPNQHPTITQGFGETNNTLEPVGPNGEQHFHYGVDIVFGTDVESFGVPLVVPFKTATLTGSLFDGQQNVATNFIQLSGVGASGNKYDVILAHVSATFPRASYNSGDIVALTGNNGLVAPLPTTEDPFAGSHLHLGLKCNGTWVNPLDYFDVTEYAPERVHQDVTELPRLQWALAQLTAEPAFNPNAPQN